ncbi:MAG: leucine-rich repeat domain-containing protein [Clostridia bacterium]|nr:leucine-rich repeat domain-containing protein [Clostridia bacterium]
MPDTITTIGVKAFFSSPISTVNIPGNVTSIGDGAFAGCFMLKTINVSPNNATFTTIGDQLYNKKTKTLVTVVAGAALKGNTIYEVTIPEGIVAIGNYAFYGLKYNVHGNYADIQLNAPKSLK